MKKKAIIAVLLFLLVPLAGCVGDTSDGSDGTQGEQGQTGQQGPSGENGTNGLVGAPGENGTDGLDGAPGENGSAGVNGQDGINGLNSLLDITNESSGENCKHGGIKIDSGLDDNRDGLLQIEEIDSFSYVCHIEIEDENTVDTTRINFDEDAILGSWRSPMKNNDITIRSQLNNCAESDAWIRTDESAMMEMMNETNQNTYVAHIGGSIYQCEYQSLLDLLSAANSSVENRNIWVGLKNWLATQQYVGLIENYSSIPVESHVGKGIIIDDYGEMIYNPWTNFGVMNNSDLQQMKNATLDSGNSQASIIPYIGAKHAVMFGGASSVIGVAPCSSSPNGCDNGSNYTFRPNDSISVSWNYTAPNDSDLSNYILRGLSYDTYNHSFPDRDLLLDISLNGVIVNSFSLAGADDYGGGVMLLDTNLPNLSVGQNQISITLNATGKEATQTHNKMAFITDLHIENLNGEIFEFEVDDGWYQKERFHINARTDFHYSQPNTDWIQSDYVDGFLFKWVAPSDDIDPVLHERFLEWFCGNLQDNDKLCIQAFWGDKQWMIDNPGDAIDYIPILENIAEYADGLLVWRMDNQQYDMEGGIYAETRADDETYHFAGMYPAYIPATEDWFQQWEFSSQSAGILEIEINDMISNTALQGRMLVTVTVDETEVYTHDLGDIELQSYFSMPVNIGSDIVIKFHTINSFGSVSWWTGIDVMVDGNVITNAESTYSSGSSQYIGFIYDLMTSAFLGDDLSELI